MKRLILSGNDQTPSEGRVSVTRRGFVVLGAQLLVAGSAIAGKRLHQFVIDRIIFHDDTLRIIAVLCRIITFCSKIPPNFAGNYCGIELILHPQNQ